MDDRGSAKKAKGTKKHVIKRRLKFDDYKDLNNDLKITTKI